jgi:TolA-binding protein
MRLTYFAVVWLALFGSLCGVFAIDIPTNITVGSLHVDDITVTAKLTPILFGFNATAWFDIPDAKGNDLKFTVSGEIGGDPLYVAFSGTQIGTWAPPFNTKDLTLDMLAIAYNSSTKAGHVSGGTLLGKWTLEVDMNFVLQTEKEVGIGFLVSNTNPNFNDLPDAPAEAYSGLPLLSAGLVIANYQGDFKFTSGDDVTVQPGINIFAEATFDGVTVLFKGKFWFDSGFHLQVTATADNFKLGDDITVQDTTVVVQYPDQPFLSVNTDMTWIDLQMHLVGVLSTSSISFTGDAPGPWNVSLGKTPLIVTSMHVDMEYDFQPKTAEGEMKGTLQYGDIPPCTVIMKYPADSTSRGCFLLSAEIGDDAASLGDMAQAASPNPHSTEGFPSDAGNLFSSPLKQLTLSAYPNCEEFTFQATIQTDNFGTVTFGFSLYKFAALGDILTKFSQTILANPQVPILGTVTVDAKTVLSTIGEAFKTKASDVLVSKAHVLHVGYDTAMEQILASVTTMRQQLLVQFTEHHIQVDAMTVLSALQTALKGVSAGFTPSSYDGESWEWEVHMSTTVSSWPISQPSELEFSIPTFALASATFQVKVGETSIMAQKGLNFVVELDISKSTASNLGTLKDIDTCASKTFQVSGYVGVTDWFLQGALTAGCISLGDDSLEISSTSLRLQHAEPQVSFDSTLTLPKMQSLAFEIDATVDTTSKSVHVSGHSQSVYETKIGVKPMDIDNVNIDLTWTSGQPPTWNAQLSGAMTLNYTTEISVSTSFDTSSKDFSFTGTIHEDNPIYFANLFEILLGKHVYDEIPFPDSLKEQIGSIRFVEGSISFDTGSKSFSASGKLEALDLMLVSFSLSFENGKFGFGFSVNPDPYHHSFKFSDFIPTIKILDVLEIYAPVAILSNGDIEMKIPGIDVVFDVHEGFSFGAMLALNASTPAGVQLHKWIGTDAVQLHALIDPIAEVFSFGASANVSFDIAKNIHLDDAGFFIAVDVPKNKIQMGFETLVTLTLSSRPQDVVPVQGQVFVSTEGVGFSASTVHDWVNPFGAQGVTVKKEAISLTMGPNFVLTQFGISGGVTVGEVDGTFDLYADAFDLAACIIAIEVENIPLGSLLESMVGESLPVAFQDSTLKMLALSLNPTGHSVTVDDKTFPAGIYLAADLSVDQAFSVDMSALLDPTQGIDIQAHVSPFTIGSVLTVSESDMDFQLLVGKPIHLILKTNTTLLTVMCACSIDISSSGIEADIQFISDVVDFSLAASSQTQDPMHVADLTASGELNIADYVAQQLPKVAKQTQDAIQPQIDALQEKINQLQGSIDDLNNKIDQKSQNDTQAKQKAEAVVASAQQSVTDAQQKVGNIQGQIDDNKKKENDCKSYDLACKAKYAAIIAGLEVEMKTAGAALDAAQYVLEKAQEALKKIPDPDVDPQIIGWKAEVLADKGLLATAQASLSALKSTQQFASQVVDAGAGAISAKQLTFSSASYLGLQKGSNGDVHLVGKFLGGDIDMHVPMSLIDAAGFVNNLWDALQKLHQNGEI